MLSRLRLQFPIDFFSSAQLWVMLIAVALPPLFFGSVDQLSISLWVGLLSIGVLCGVAEPLSRNQYRVAIAFLSLCGVYAAVACLQLIPYLFGPLNDPIWQQAGGLLGLDLKPRISSRAEIPPVAIGHFLLLITSLLGGFFCATSRQNAEKVFLTARFAIVVYALYGLFALALTPSLILWAPKTAYRGYLTSTFINHNTAATLVGAGLILWICSAIHTLQSLGRLTSVRLLLLIPSNEQIGFKLVLRAGAGLVCLFALLLTGSRGGLICTALGLLVAVMLLVSNRVKLSFRYGIVLAAVALLIVVGWLGQIGVVANRGLFDDGRWAAYGLSLEVIRNHPWLGVGAGTFADLFPSLRPDDFKSWGVWDFAHSTIIEIALEMGVPVALMVVGGCAASLYILIRAAQRSSEHSRVALAAVSGIAVLSYLHSTIDFSLQIPGYLIPFGILLGCGLARATAEPAKRRSQRSSDELVRPTLLEVGPLTPGPVPSEFVRGPPSATP